MFLSGEDNVVVAAQMWPFHGRVEESIERILRRRSPFLPEAPAAACCLANLDAAHAARECWAEHEMTNEYATFSE